MNVVNMRRRDFLRVGAGAAWLLRPTAVPAGQTATQLDDAAIDRIEHRIATVMRDRAVPGVSIAIVNNGRLQWQRAFGVRDATGQEPVTEQTTFEAASVSKTVFAYVALKLCERGRLGLDTPLAKYTKTPFIEGDARIDRVTARQVLCHASGLPEWRSAAALQFETNPGQKFRYSGEGYYYLQSVMTEIAGRRFSSPCGHYEGDLQVCATNFDEFMRRSLLDPLAMTASGYEWHERFERTAARPHDIKGQPLAQKKPNAADIARYGAVGELRTTPSDYAKFLLAVLNLPPGDAFLGRDMRAEMIRPQVRLDPGEKIDGADAWALGWAIQERPTGNVILHSGGQSGFRSLTMASVDRKSGFVIFTNSDSGGFVCFDPELGTLLAPLLAG